MFRLNFKRTALFAALFVTAMLNLSAPAYGADYAIGSYEVRITVDENRLHRVEESIETEFYAPRHGIIRSIPLGSSIEPYKIENLSCNQPYTESRSGDLLNVKIGNPDRYANQRETYLISYDMKFAKDPDKTGDMVYVSPIGTQWDAPIGEAKITIELPSEDIESVTMYRGGYGSSAESQDYTVEGNVITARAAALGTGEGLTFYIRLPEGTFDAPASLAPVESLICILIIAAALAIFILALRKWRRMGRDEPIISVVEFYPPDGMNPAELACVVKGGAGTEAVSAILFFWASKGYIRYIEEKKGFTLEKISAPGEERPQYERKAFGKLFGLGDGERVTSKEIEKGFYETAQDILINARVSFRGKRAMESREQGKASAKLLLLSLVPTLLYGVLAAVTDRAFNGFVGIFAVLAACGLALGLIQRKRSGGFGKGASAALAVILSLVITVICSALMEVRLYGNVLVTFLITALSSAAGFTAALINRRTAYANDIIGRGSGFADFLKTAEKDRIEALAEENPSYFFDTLPYAAALGVTKVWADKFRDIIKEPPQWYRGSGDIYTPYVFMRAINMSSASVNRSIQNAAVKNSGFSGGSSFGGFSGGGAGGGGGSSW